MKLKIWNKFNNNLLIAILLIVISFFSLPYFFKEDTNNPEKKESVKLEEMINNLSEIKDLKENIYQLENKQDYFLKYLFRLENQFFIVLDNYYQSEKNREKLKSKVDYLLIKKDFLKKIPN
jgi:hypothetical protein